MRSLPTLLAVVLLATPSGAQQAPNATLDPADLAEISAQPAKIQQLIAAALALTRRHLGYTYGSDDPARGGMDCSGTIYNLLRAQGWKDVPRDSPGQYEWTRTAGGFHEVIGKSADSPEFADLRPGDLMFWSGTYEIHRTGTAVSHVMLYLGTEAKTHKRVMFGASDGRTYNGIQRFGVSVFDFKMPRPDQVKTDFLGYSRIPGLPGGTAAKTAAVTTPAKKEREETSTPNDGPEAGTQNNKPATRGPASRAFKPVPLSRHTE